MSARAGAFVVVMVTALGCGQRPAASGPCQAEVDALIYASAGHAHGLTQADDVRETADRLQRALACADDSQIVTVMSHARLLMMELAARGNDDGLRTLAEILDRRQHPAAATQKHRVLQLLRDGSEAARLRLAQRSRVLGGEAGTDPKRGYRASLAEEAFSGGAAVAPPRETLVFVNLVTADESCVSVIPGHALPTGMANVSILRGGTRLTLHGDSPAVKLPPADPRSGRLRLCIAGALQSGDVVRVDVDGRAVFEEALAVGSDEWARGIPLSALRGAPLSRAVCAGATSLDARAACSLIPEVTP